jgi:hypothetical protein
MENIGDLVKRAMLDPDLAHALLMKAPERDTGPIRSVSLTQQLKRLSMFAAADSAAGTSDTPQRKIPRIVVGPSQ